ncbi:MAG: hypothetical protein AB8B53_13095 [Flavobacteriales bacterium]
MTLGFFDFYPIITRSSTFGDLLNQGSYYFIFNGGNLLVLFAFFVLSFTPFARAFRRKHMVYSVLLAMVIMLVMSLVERQFSSMRLSNILLEVTYNFITISLSYFILFFIPYFTGERLTEIETVAKLRALPVIEQVIFLALLFVSIFSFKHLAYLPVVVFTLLYGIHLFFKSKHLQPLPLKYVLRDAIPLVIIILVGLGISFIKVSSVVCNIPVIREYFTCP